MRIERSITTVSWIPSDLLEGMGKIATRMKMAHHDPPPPDPLGPDVAGRDRGAPGQRSLPVRQPTPGIHRRRRRRPDHRLWLLRRRARSGATTVGLGVGFDHDSGDQAARHPGRTRTWDRRRCGSRQTVGGRTGAPMPRAVKRPPFIQYSAPTVWTTLELTINTDGTHTGALTGASGFPATGCSTTSGALVAKSSVAEYKKWMNTSFGRRTPWGDEDSPALVTEVETQLERSSRKRSCAAARSPTSGGSSREPLVEQGSIERRTVPAAQRCARGRGRRRAARRGRARRRAG